MVDERTQEDVEFNDLMIKKSKVTAEEVRAFVDLVAKDNRPNNFYQFLLEDAENEEGDESKKEELEKNLDPAGWKYISHYHFTGNAAATHDHAIRRLNFMDTEVNQANIHSAKMEIKFDKQNISGAIMLYAKRLFLKFADQRNIRYGPKRNQKCMSFDDYKASLLTVKKKEQMAPYAWVNYLDWDNEPDGWEKMLAGVAMIQQKVIWRNTETDRKGKNCVEKLVSEVMSNIRKAINSYGLEQVGWYTGCARHPSMIDEDDPNGPAYHREHGVYYDWYIKGDGVSFFTKY